MKINVLALSPMLIAAGCTLSNEHASLEAYTTKRLEAMLASDQNAVPAGTKTAAVKLPPGAGHFTGMVERTDGNIHRQEILLTGSVVGLPVNRAEIVAVRSGGADADALGASLKPSDPGIHAELAARFPRTVMRVIAEPRRNSYGPIGLAVGLAPKGVRCIYAWQWLDAVQAAESGQPVRALFRSRPTLSASIRISICRAHKTADELASYVEQLQLEPSMLQPQVTAKAQSLEATLIAPATASSTGTLPRNSKISARRRRRHVHAAKVANAPFDDSGDAVDQAVTADGAAAERAPPLPRASFIPAPGDSGHARGASAPVFTTLAPPATLDPSLPSQAYLGPSSVTNTRPRDAGENAATGRDAGTSQGH